MHPPVAGGDGDSLRRLLCRFKPATPIDKDLILAFFLSLVWGGQPGQRPAWLFTSEDGDPTGRGVGKSTMPKMGARLVGGHLEVRTNEGMDKLMPRLLSSDAITRRFAMIDNVKTLRFSWEELEALVTTDTISGHQFYVGEGRRPNTLTWALTLNGASLSTDMAQRFIIVKVDRNTPRHGKRRRSRSLTTSAEIIGDLIAILKRPAQTLATCSRWGAWERGVLAQVDEPSKCQRVIEERQAEADNERSESDGVAEHLADGLRNRGHVPDTDVVFIPSADAAQMLNEATGERYATNRANAYLGVLRIPQLRKSDRGSGRGWIWIGKNAPVNATAVRLKPRDCWNHAAH